MIKVKLANGAIIKFPDDTTQNQMEKIIKENSEQIKSDGKYKFDNDKSNEITIRPNSNDERNYFSRVVSNIGPSGVQYAKDFVTPFLEPVKTAKSLYALGSGIVELAIPGEQGNEEIARQVGQHFADRYGGLDEIKETFATDPVGVFGDLSLILTGGAGIAAKTAGKASKITKALKVASDVTEPAILAGKAAKGIVKGSTQIPVVGNSIAKAGQFVADAPGNLASNVLGTTTGAGGEAITEAYKAGFVGGDVQQALIDNLRGVANAEEVVQDAMNAVKNMEKKKIKKFTASKELLELEKTPIDFSKVEDAVKDFDIENTIGGNISELSAGAQKKLDDVYKIVQEYSDDVSVHTAEGLDSLKKKLDAEYPLDFTGKRRNEQRVIADIRSRVVKQITEQVPDYAKVMKPYYEATLLEAQIIKELSLGKKANAGTTLRKLKSTMSANGKTNFGNRLDMIKALENAEGVSLLPQLAGQALNQFMPRGIASLPLVGASLLNPKAMLAIPFTSPRVVGEGALALGQARRSIGDISGAVAPYVPSIKTARPAGVLARETDESTPMNQRESGLIKSLLGY